MLRNITLIVALISLYGAAGFTQQIQQINKLVASDRESEDNFGFRIDIDQDYAISSSWHEGTIQPGYATRNGAAYIYRKNLVGEWIEVQKLVADQRERDDSFGKSVAISDKYVLVGCGNGGVHQNMRWAGSVFAFERQENGHWIQTQELVPSDLQHSASFGQAISMNGDYAVIGAHNETITTDSTQSIQWAGAAYVFKRINGQWVEVQKLTASDPMKQAYFGQYLSMNKDDIVISAERNELDVNGDFPLKASGAVYAFKRDSTEKWIETQKLVAFDRARADMFGRSVSVDGDFIAVGASYKNKGEGKRVGAVYMFNRDTLGQWSKVQKLEAQDQGHMDHFGASVALNSNMIIISASGDYDDEYGQNELSEAGSAYVFKTDDCKVWYQHKKITANHRGLSANFGHSVAFSGNHIMVGAGHESYDTNQSRQAKRAGSAYMFKVSAWDFASCGGDQNAADQNEEDSNSDESSDNPNTRPSVIKPIFQFDKNICYGQFILEILSSLEIDYKVEVLNPLGMSVYSTNIDSERTLINLPKRSRGIYMVRVWNEYGEASKPIVVKKKRK